MSPLLYEEELVAELARKLRGLRGTAYARCSLAELEARERGFLDAYRLAAMGNPAPLVQQISTALDDRRQQGIRLVDLHRAIAVGKATIAVGGWSREEVRRICAAMDAGEIALLEAFERELEEADSTDFLTGIANRRVFIERLEQELSRARRLKSDFAIAMIDIDDLKPVNDSHGHAAGDEVLQALATTLAMHCRAGIDVPARIGGDEFACLFVGASEAGAASAMLRVAESFAHATFSEPGVRVSISWGIAGWRKFDSAAAMMRRADRHLYAMKHVRQPRAG